MIVKSILIILASYLIGAVPFGIIIGKVTTGKDIRQMGSGNIGAANAFRTLGIVPGTLVLAADILKGVAAVYLSKYLSPAEWVIILNILAGFFAIIGHNYSVFLKFGGGKGIATSFGVFLALSPLASLIALGIYLIMLFTTKYSSVGSLTATLSIPISMYFLHQRIEYIIFAVLAAIIAFYKHKANIMRLVKGEELKVFDKK